MKHNSKVANATTRDEFNLSDSEAVAIIKARHRQHSKGEIIELYKRSFGQLVEDFIVEKNAKNKGYYFILSQGHFNAFSDYCKNH